MAFIQNCDYDVNCQWSQRANIIKSMAQGHKSSCRHQQCWPLANVRALLLSIDHLGTHLAACAICSERCLDEDNIDQTFLMLFGDQLQDTCAEDTCKHSLDFLFNHKSLRKLRRSAVACEQVAAPLIGFTILVRRGLIWKLYWSAGRRSDMERSRKETGCGTRLQFTPLEICFLGRWLPWFEGWL